MKVIVTKSCKKQLIAQQIYNPDDPNNPMDMSDVDFGDESNIEEPLETVTPDDLEKKSQDAIEEDEKSEPQQVEQPPTYPVFNTVFQALRWAKQNKETVRISYTTLSGKTLLRDVEPVGDFFPKTTARRNVAVWDKTIGDIRTYIIARITECKFTGVKFTPKFNFSQRRKNYLRRLKRRMKRNK